MKIKRISLQTGNEELFNITVKLIRKISDFNTYLNPYLVIKELRKGARVYGSFSAYELETGK